MKKLKYSPDAREKLKQIKQYVTQKFGADTAGKVTKEMTKSIRDLQKFEEKGISVESVLGIPCDFRMLYVQHNYVFYQIEVDVIKITDIYNEKEDFMWKLFGIKTTTEEAENYWKD
ncbi:MAG: type II toxin-antitoxin system RelE/ParE family toxin [Muribaculaceae bacterium]|nr:type II toxin-antitoxin system RelE/ParE family toxin [Roseburia sp.]MCM1430178.1 type II toxin-antitoxin system RelE/ParE family toxin [Muribaculaceae bacterium]MCM1493108.1 type II toxin-antitoxin system RelE/ParE family toxin [Muribaculaceae bacterium]